jgi:hypothetical protein
VVIVFHTNQAAPFSFELHTTIGELPAGRELIIKYSYIFDIFK